MMAGRRLAPAATGVSEEWAIRRGLIRGHARPGSAT
jgi:hypothetical protein